MDGTKRGYFDKQQLLNFKNIWKICILRELSINNLKKKRKS